ncbi:MULTISPECIES: hypothetical protein [Phyllobacterium]|uniref:hypothetical protein n=1 Tax=Phyllobacterium TaxID=28100 RepID=UPI001CC0118A|nr:hypothetical protein [Phyllobacterium calauticae]MBZ3695512.1 hypothetical protein [Phyllobacterium calauticae]
MTYTIEPSKSGGWRVIDPRTREGYGGDCPTIEEAQKRLSQAEADAAMKRMYCRAGSCSL